MKFSTNEQNSGACPKAGTKNAPHLGCSFAVKIKPESPNSLRSLVLYFGSKLTNNLSKLSFSKILIYLASAVIIFEALLFI